MSAAATSTPKGTFCFTLPMKGDLTAFQAAGELSVGMVICTSAKKIAMGSNLEGSPAIHTEEGEARFLLISEVI